jgi:gamma-glutamyltranspeptidase/glutathione hydrolase
MPAPEIAAKVNPEFTMLFRILLLLILLLVPLRGQPPLRGMVVAQERLAAEAGAQVLRDGGNAVDAAVATAFALAVTHPIAGNLGGGGFLLLREPGGGSEFLDFRERAPGVAHPRMFLKDGRYDPKLHHDSLAAVGVPGTVAGLHQAWRRHGRLPWRRLLVPAIRMAREGIEVTPNLARSLEAFLPEFAEHPPTLAQFSRNGRPLVPGALLKQNDLARTLERIAKDGPKDFYRGRTARLLLAEMKRHGGLITARDLRDYRPAIREPLKGGYRGVELLTAPPPSAGGMILLQALNVLEGWDIRAMGPGSADIVHVAAEALRRAFADRARWMGDADFVKDLPLGRLISKDYAADLRKGIRMDRASVSDPSRFEWPLESNETTHLSVLDRDGRAVSLTYTLEDNYGVKRIVPGAGFLLNNEMGDFNAGPGLTDRNGRIGTPPNLAAPGKRMLSSMAPCIAVKGGKVFLVTGSPGGRTIPCTVLQTILGAVDFDLNAQAAVDAPRMHHQWLPDRIVVERGALAAEQKTALERKGHVVAERPLPGRHEGATQGSAQVILVIDGKAQGGADRKRSPDSAAVAE